MGKYTNALTELDRSVLNLLRTMPIPSEKKYYVDNMPEEMAWKLIYCLIELDDVEHLELLLNKRMEKKPIILEELLPIAATSLHWEEQKPYRVFDFLLQEGSFTFNPDVFPDQLGYFNLAIYLGHIETIRRSLERLDPSRTTIYIRRKGEISCLEWAMQCNQEKIAKLLSLFYLEHPAIIRAQEGTKQTIFYYAIDHNIVDIVETLLNPPHLQELDLKQRQPLNLLSALYCAMRARLPIKNSKKNPEDAHIQKAAMNSSKIISRLLEVGADFGHEAAYCQSQIELIEGFRKKCIIPSYMSKIESCVKQFSAPVNSGGNISSIIAEYVVPLYAEEDPQDRGLKKPRMAEENPQNERPKKARRSP